MGVRGCRGSLCGVLAPAVQSPVSRHPEGFRKRCPCLALGVEGGSVEQLGRVGTGNLSQRPEPQFPLWEVQMSSIAGLSEGPPRVALAFFIKPQRCHLPHPTGGELLPGMQCLCRTLACSVSAGLKLRGGRGKGRVWSLRSFQNAPWGPSSSVWSAPVQPSKAPLPVSALTLVLTLKHCIRTGA